MRRAYRHDLRCPHCGSNWLPKYGRSRGKQSYRCGYCLYKFTPGGNRSYYSEAVKSQAVEMYCEGSAIAAISRVLGVKVGTVGSWIKKSLAVVARQSLDVVNTERRRRVDSEAEVISFDEMWTYVDSRRKVKRSKIKRNSVWIWTAVVEEGDGSRWMDYEVGDRGEETFLRLYERLPDAKRYRSDDYNVYRRLPSRIHKVGKGTPLPLRRQGAAR